MSNIFLSVLGDSITVKTRINEICHFNCLKKELTCSAEGPLFDWLLDLSERARFLGEFCDILDINKLAIISDNWLSYSIMHQCL